VLRPRKCFGSLQFCICLAVLHNIICLQFFICILRSVLLFYVFVTRESPSVSPLCFITQNAESACSRNPWTLQFASAVIVTRPDLTREWNKRVRWIRHLQKALTKPWFRKQGATLANFIMCHQKLFVPKHLSLKFMHIYADDQGTFWLVFALYFTSCYN